MVYDPERIVNIGELEKRGKTVRFGIKEKDRSRHIYVIGQTGTGKSTLLEMLAMQDIRNGTGLIFMDPHGQSVEALLNYVTQDYLENIIYFAPHHQERPIGLNIMEDIGYDKRHLVVSSLMASFEKIWGAGTWSDRMAYILQNTLLALIEYPGTTLLDVGRMYSSKGFREKVVANLKDPQVRKYWVEEFANYTERYAQEATPSIQNKLGQFTSNPLMRNIIGQKESAFNFREIMDEGKILLVNLSKGQIGENNARMLGVLFTTKIYLAALSRSDMTKAELEAANPCNFFVDEFQSFANSSFSDILSEARKYKLNLVMAHQYLGQLYSDDAGGGDVIRDAVFGNVGTFVSFRVGPVDAEIISKQFAPDITEEDLVALPRYHIYLTLNIDGAGSTPFSARTFYEPAPEGVSLEEEVVRRTMDVYGVDRATVEKMVEDNLAEDAQMNEAAKKVGGQKGGGKKFGGQQGSGQKGGGRYGDGKKFGGQKGGGRQNVSDDGQKSAETHTPLKGLVQQMMQRSGQQKLEKPKTEKLKEEGPKAEKLKEGRLKERTGGVEKHARGQVETFDFPKMDSPRKEKVHVQRSRKDASRGQVVEQAAGERVMSEQFGRRSGRRDVAGEKADVSAQEEVGALKGRGGDGERGARKKAERHDLSRANETRERARQKGGRKKMARKAAVASDRRSVDEMEDQRSDGEKNVQKNTERLKLESSGRRSEQEDAPGGRRGRRRTSGDAVSDRQRSGKKRYSTSKDVDDRREIHAAVQDDGRQRDQRRLGRAAVSHGGKDAGRRQRQEKRDGRGKGGMQKQGVAGSPTVRSEVEVRGIAKHRNVVAKTKDRGGQVQQKEKEKQSQSSGTLRRPSGVVFGSVSRSAVVQQSATDQGVIQSGVSGEQQSVQGAVQQSGKRSVSGGLGDLVKTAKASGLRKDLKVAPKKERNAPPVNYEEGWVAIGDLARE